MRSLHLYDCNFFSCALCAPLINVYIQYVIIFIRFVFSINHPKMFSLYPCAVIFLNLENYAIIY